MNKLTLLILTLLITGKVVGQINMEDSTIQVIGYWDNKETQSYTISFEKYTVTDADTTSREFTTYDVDITIKDSTEKSYTIEWFYRNFKNTTDNKLLQRISSLAQDMRVIIKTDEMGAFVEVVNWKEVRDYMKKTASAIKSEFKDVPEIDKIIKESTDMLLTKEAIQLVAIKDVHQFYSFHGARYTLGEEITAKVQLPNLFGGNPFDADVTLVLDEINVVDENSILRMWQSVDSEQLTNATYEYMRELAKTMKTQPPVRAEFPPLTNETSSASRIHGPSGWVIYSIETKEVTADNVVNFEERIIEIK